ncbi:MAG: rRNA maturation RNase YbeY [Acidimicrobiia bacterium]|nr:rRNA maturation RNase YbeY [Acidimicrobiia bacterium]
MTDPPTIVFAADEQHDVPIDLQRWTRLAGFVLAAEGVRVPMESELSLIFVDEASIAELNRRFLDGSGPTDVLAFPMDEQDDDPRPRSRFPDQGGRGPGVPSEQGGPPVLLGDVVVCPAVAKRQADERGIQVEAEVALLVVHGILHLLDYDHAEPAETVAMESRQQELLREFSSHEDGG